MDQKQIRALLDAQDWGDIHARLYDFAKARCKSKVRGKDLAQTAIMKVWAFDSKWDPEKEPLLLRHLMSVVNSVLANERTSAAEQRNVSIEEKRARAHRVADDRAPSPERLAEADRHGKAWAALERALAEDRDDDALRVLALTLEGTETPADLEAATGWDMDKVNAVRLRVQRRAAAVLAEIDQPDEEEVA